MKCGNPDCPDKNKDHFALFSGVCKTCFDAGIIISVTPPKRSEPEKKKMGRPVSDKPFDMAQYQKDYWQKNKEKRKKYFAQLHKQQYTPRPVIRYVIEFEGLYAQSYNKPKWGELSTAKRYRSLPKANNAVRELGKGTVVKL